MINELMKQTYAHSVNSPSSFPYSTN